MSVASSAVSAWALGDVWLGLRNQGAEIKIDNMGVSEDTKNHRNGFKRSSNRSCGSPMALGYREIGTQQALPSLYHLSRLTITFSLWWTSCLYEGEALQMTATALLLHDACVSQGEGFCDTQKPCVLFHAPTNLFVYLFYLAVYVRKSFTKLRSLIHEDPRCLIGVTHHSVEVD